MAEAPGLWRRGMKYSGDMELELNDFDVRKWLQRGFEALKHCALQTNPPSIKMESMRRSVRMAICLQNVLRWMIEDKFVAVADPDTLPVQIDDSDLSKLNSIFIAP